MFREGARFPGNGANGLYFGGNRAALDWTVAVASAWAEAWAEAMAEAEAMASA